MKISILLCDEITEDRKELANMHGSYLQMYENFFSGALEDAEITNGLIESYYATKGEFPKHDPDIMVISGSRLDADSDDNAIKNIRKKIVDSKKKGVRFIGFCFGHQAIALALNGSSGRHPGGWTIGIGEIFPEEQPQWLNSTLTNLRVVYSCRDQVNKLPSGAQRLFTSKQVNNAGYFIDNNVLCIQGHPEFSKGYGKALVELKYKNGDISEEFYFETIKSFDYDPDNTKFRQIVADFIKANKP